MQESPDLFFDDPIDGTPEIVWAQAVELRDRQNGVSVSVPSGPMHYDGTIRYRENLSVSDPRGWSHLGRLWHARDVRTFIDHVLKIRAKARVGGTRLTVVAAPGERPYLQPIFDRLMELLVEAGCMVGTKGSTTQGAGVEGERLDKSAEESEEAPPAASEAKKDATVQEAGESVQKQTPVLSEKASPEEWFAWLDWYYAQAWGPMPSTIAHIAELTAKSESSCEKMHALYMQIHKPIRD